MELFVRGAFVPEKMDFENSAALATFNLSTFNESLVVKYCFSSLLFRLPYIPNVMIYYRYFFTFDGRQRGKLHLHYSQVPKEKVDSVIEKEHWTLMGQCLLCSDLSLSLLPLHVCVYSQSKFSRQKGKLM